MSDAAARSYAARNIGGARSPVMPDNSKVFKPKPVSQVKQILSQSRELSRARSLRESEPGCAEASQIGDDRLEPSSVQSGQDSIPGSDIIGPTMKQDHWMSIRRARQFTSDRKCRAFYGGQLHRDLLA